MNPTKAKRPANWTLLSASLENRTLTNGNQHE